jgi:hypothetical protein
VETLPYYIYIQFSISSGFPIDIVHCASKSLSLSRIVSTAAREGASSAHRQPWRLWRTRSSASSTTYVHGRQVSQPDIMRGPDNNRKHTSKRQITPFIRSRSNDTDCWLMLNQSFSHLLWRHSKKKRRFDRSRYIISTMYLDIHSPSQKDIVLAMNLDKCLSKFITKTTSFLGRRE